MTLTGTTPKGGRKKVRPIRMHWHGVTQLLRGESWDLIPHSPSRIIYSTTHLLTWVDSAMKGPPGLGYALGTGETELRISWAQAQWHSWVEWKAGLLGWRKNRSTSHLDPSVSCLSLGETWLFSDSPTLWSRAKWLRESFLFGWFLVFHLSFE